MVESEIKLLRAKAEDCLRLCAMRNIPKFLGFLSPGEAAELHAAITAPNAYFFGGYPLAERRMFGALPDYITTPQEAFPIASIRISFRKADVLSHRDVLGTIMATGITREKVGDIRFGEGFALVFTADEIADYLVEQIKKIGRVGVTVQRLTAKEIELTLPPPKKEPISFTVSSPRLDAVVAGLTGCSRSKVDEWIENGLVFVNSFAVYKTTGKIQAGDTVTIRKIGKFIIVKTGSFSKKGREIILAEKYI